MRASVLWVLSNGPPRQVRTMPRDIASVGMSAPRSIEAEQADLSQAATGPDPDPQLPQRWTLSGC
jgi:hypothetical protein